MDISYSHEYIFKTLQNFWDVERLSVRSFVREGVYTGLALWCLSKAQLGFELASEDWGLIF